MGQIHVFGDSHSHMFWRAPNAWIHHLGPITMHRVGRDGISLFKLDELELSVDDKLAFVFGEIDVRVHVEDQRKKTGNPACDIIDDLAQRYMRTLIEIRDSKYPIKIAVASLVPPAAKSNSGSDEHYPRNGSDEDRVTWTRYMNARIKILCYENEFSYIDQYEMFCDRNGLIDLRFTTDGTHINPDLIGQINISEFYTTNRPKANEREHLMTFMTKFDQEFWPLLDRRAAGFRTIFKLLEDMHKQRYVILETGTLRIIDNWAGDGQSTRLFDAFVNFHEGSVFSVDIDPAAAAQARAIVSQKTHCICSDSVQFLRDFGLLSGGFEGVDLIYLDSFDLVVEDPDPSSFHHMKELMAIGKLASGTLLAVDDNFAVNEKEIGKGRMISAYFKNINVPLVYDGYQKVWQIP